MIMPDKKLVYITLCVLLPTPMANAQPDVWSGLARTQFDSAASTLRIPCAVLEDENRNSIPGFAPAYALNLLLLSAEPDNEVFRLVNPIQTFEEIPESCLDTVTVSSSGSIATYTTSSTEIDVDAAANAETFYTLELQANLSAPGPLEFSVLSADSRNYRRPFYDAEIPQGFPPNQPFTLDFIYDDAILEGSLNAMNQNLQVFEPGRIAIECFYFDPNELLELVEVVGANERYRLKASVNVLDNGIRFSVHCTVFNRDLNRLDLTVPVLDWVIFF